MADAMFTMDCNEQFKLLEEHKNIEPMLAPMFEGMCNTLAMGIEEYLRAFDVDRGVNLLCDIGMTKIPSCGDAATMCLRALSLILEHVPHAAQYATGNPRVLLLVRDRLNTHKALRYEVHAPSSLVEDALRIVRFLNEEDANGAVVASGVLSEVVRVMESSDGSTAMRSLEAMVMMCDKVKLYESKACPAPAPAKKPATKKGKAPPVAPTPAGSLASRLRRELETTVVPSLSATLRRLLGPHADDASGAAVPPVTADASVGAAAVAAFGDVWPAIDNCVRCLTTLLKRIDLAARISHGGPPTSYVPKDSLLLQLSGPDVAQLLFSALLSPQANNDVRRESVVAALVDVATVHPAALWGTLLERRVVDWFVDVLQPAKRDLGSLLENPFPNRSGGTSMNRASPGSPASAGTRSALLVSGAAFLLQHALPAVPPEKQSIHFTVLPVHEWDWSDDLRAFSPYPDENCTQIEIARFHGHRNVVCRIRGTEYLVDFDGMKQLRLGGGASRPIRRKATPRTFTFADASSPPRQHGDDGIPASPAPLRPTAATDELSLLLSVYGPILMSLCATASNEVHRAMAACGVAKLYAAAASLPDFRRVMAVSLDDMAEYAATTLAAADDLLSIDSCLIAMQTVFEHGDNSATDDDAAATDSYSSLQFAAVCRRFGVVEKLAALRPRLESKVIETSPTKKKGGGFESSTGGKKDISQHVEQVLGHVKALTVLCEQRPSSVRRADAPSSPTANAPLAAAVELFNKSSDDFKEAYLPDLIAQIGSSGANLTIHEFSQVAVARSLATFVLPVVEGTTGLDENLSKRRVGTLAAALRANPVSAAVLVRQLVGELGLAAKKLPEAEVLAGPNQPRCRHWHDALSRLAQLSPNVSLCCFKSHAGTPVPAAASAPSTDATPDRRTLCPQGHRLKQHHSTSWSCDLCFRESNGDASMACRACDFDLCPDCYMNDDVGYQGGEFDPDTPSCSDDDDSHHDDRSGLPGVVAHLGATVGDLERHFRENKDPELRVPSDLLPSGRGAAAPTEAFPGRFDICYEGVGRVPLQETLLGVLYKKAAANDIRSALVSLENAMMMEDARGLPADKTPSRGGGSPAESPTRSRTFYFHVIPGDGTDGDAKCSCGEYTRTRAVQEAQEHEVRSRRHAKPSDFFVKSKTTLLWLLFNICCGRRDDGQGEFVNPAVLHGSTLHLLPNESFVCHELAVRAVKATGASALRVALLPPQLALPSWLLEVLESAPFLLPLSVRQSLATFIAGGARRSLYQAVSVNGADLGSCRIVSAEWARAFGNRPKTKETIRRGDHLLSDASKALWMAAEQRASMMFEFEGDKGTGLGPTVQFFSQVAKAMCESSLGLWRATGDGTVSVPPEGLYPRPRPVSFSLVEGESAPVPHPSPLPPHLEKLYYICGAAAARAFLDGRVFPLPLSAALWQHLRSRALFTRRRAFGAADMGLIDESVANVLRVLAGNQAKRARTEGDAPHSPPDEELAAMCLTFVVPGQEDVELILNGAETEVSPTNVVEFCRSLVRVMGTVSVSAAIDAFERGFSDVVPLYASVPMGPKEFDAQIGGIATSATEPLWTRDELKRCITGNHGYNRDSVEVQLLVEVLLGFSPMEQSDFLNFCTGCPRLPVGGMTALGHITVVRKDPLQGEEKTKAGPAVLGLPSVNTCFKYLKLPPYADVATMRDCLLKAIRGSGDSFDLS